MQQAAFAGELKRRIVVSDRQTHARTDGRMDERSHARTDGRTDTERGCRINLANYRCRMSCQTDARTHHVNLYIRFFKMQICSMFVEPFTQNFKELVNHLLRNVLVEAYIALLF